MRKKIHTPNIKNGPVKTGQVFSLKAPTAKAVELAGDFTQWQEQPVALQKEDDGVWRTTLELQPGEYHYRLLVDGNWFDDEEYPYYAPNPYGGRNAVRQVT
jgi:1,4-alpha-glucan branching enzyme